jgi:hypothetical protein
VQSYSLPNRQISSPTVKINRRAVKNIRRAARLICCLSKRPRLLVNNKTTETVSFSIQKLLA